MTEGQSWTLISRVSNKGEKHWTWSSGWWEKYDMTDGEGNTTNPLDGEDMISPAFWLVVGDEFMITRSDDPNTVLLQTTDDCLEEQTFRDKIQTSKGGIKPNKCGSNCNVRYGGQYQETEGFEQANESRCSPANLQTGNEIGFWCKHSRSNKDHSTRAVMMIGAGGNGCSGADHGIGIKHGPGDNKKKDFGNKADGSPITDYSLNLWVH